MTQLQSIPLVTSLNHIRSDFYAKSHDLNRTQSYPVPEPRSSCEKTMYWIGHKALSLVAFPANASVVALGCAGIATISLPIAALKVAINAATLGHVKPTISTGFVWFAKRIEPCSIELLKNYAELIFDGGRLAIDAASKIDSIITALKLDYIFNQIAKPFVALVDRVITGIDLACRDELAVDTPPLNPKLKELWEQCYKTSCFELKRQPGTWFEHKMHSIKAIPQFTLVALECSAACLCGAAAIAAKVAIYTVTGKHISRPTHISQNAALAFKTGGLAALIGAEVAGDCAIAIYDVAKWTGIARAIATARDVLLYIPKAIIS